MSVQTLKDGRVICRFVKGTDPDHPNRTREYFGRGPEAEEAAWLRNLELGLGKRKTVSSPTFISLVNSYLDAKEGRIAVSTYEKMTVRLDGTILPRIGHLQAHSLTVGAMNDYVKQRSRDNARVFIGKDKKTGANKYKDKATKVKKASIHRELTDIRMVLRWAAESRLIAENPMAGFEMPEQDNAVITPPSKPEFDAIFACASPHLKRAMLISYYTGLRPGKEELLPLTWDLVDFHNNTLTVISAQKGGLPSRMVPLHNKLLKALGEWYDEDEKKHGGDIGRRYIVNYYGRKVDCLITAWAGAKKRARVRRRLRMYDMRHAFATGMLRKGASLKSVSELLGHASPEITARVYQHVDTQEKRDAIDLLD